MSIHSVSTSVAALSDSIKVTFHLINRLSKLSFQPGSTPLDEDGDVRLELAQDIRDHLKQNDDHLERLKQEADDLINVTAATQRRRDSIKDRERARIAAQVARLDEELKHARGQFRKAQLTAKRASEAAKQKERELLFASIQQEVSTPASGTSTPDLFAGRRQRETKQLTQDEVLVNASTDVTSALRRTHDLLTSELSRSRFAQETLDQSTAALADLGERYSDLDTLLSNSKTLLGTLVRSQKSDTWYLETAFYILCATICWLVFRRLIYGPAWWFLWLPLKFLLIKPFYYIFAAFGIVTRAQPSPATTITASRLPLRVQPSASGGSRKFVMSGDQRQADVPVGGGGRGAKVGLNGKLSEEIGNMAEASRQQPQHQDKQNTQPSEEADNVVRRGDGTVLQDRGDRPVNPKKKQWEEDVESTKHQSRKRDEL